jgi:hypothetical protein
MGTNFYFRGHSVISEYDNHIGKRSAAGVYCWDCRIKIPSPLNPDKKAEECPSCHKKFKEESLEESSGGRELGFNKSKPKKKTGVATCAKFAWAMNPKEVMDQLKKKPGPCPCCGKECKDPEKVVKDEYGNTYTEREFLDVLEECPIKTKDMIGVAFS